MTNNMLIIGSALYFPKSLYRNIKEYCISDKTERWSAKSAKRPW
ncbi:hypothetical protein [Nostoc sp. NIES-3756]|nr:hypothetical protein [Nostoc sp. NIES-3756]